MPIRWNPYDPERNRTRCKVKVTSRVSGRESYSGALCSGRCAAGMTTDILLERFMARLHNMREARQGEHSGRLRHASGRTDAAEGFQGA